MKLDYVGPGLTECRLCFAVVRNERLKGHESWHCGGLGDHGAWMTCEAGCVGTIVVRNGATGSTLCPKCGRELVGA